MQYLDTGWFGLAVTALLVAFILFNISRTRGGRDLFIRRIPGLNAIDEAVGRASEMGKPVLMVPGLSDPLNAVGMQAINICSYVTRVAAKFANPILMCAFGATLYAASQEAIRDVYQSEGLEDLYDVDSVRFISDRQFAFAAGVSGLLVREQAAAAVFVGEFYAESLIFAETANSVGAIQVASSTETTQTPFFIAACDYVLIGDEFYAASAYLTRQPVLVGSLIGQDWSKLLILFAVLFGCISATIQLGPFHHTTISEERVKTHMVPTKNPETKQDQPRLMRLDDTDVSHMFKPQRDPDALKVTRVKDPEFTGEAE